MNEIYLFCKSAVWRVFSDAEEVVIFWRVYPVVSPLIFILCVYHTHIYVLGFMHCMVVVFS